MTFFGSSENFRLHVKVEIKVPKDYKATNSDGIFIPKRLAWIGFLSLQEIYENVYFNKDDVDLECKSFEIISEDPKIC